MQHINPDAVGVWQTLFSKALVLIDYVETRTGASLFWTFGGGTVLMLRHNHRQSKDIDIFIPDPQSLVVRFIRDYPLEAIGSYACPDSEHNGV